MMTPVHRFVLPLLCELTAASAFAQSPALSPQVPSSEQRLAASCTNCHGPQGQSRHEGIRSLAGKPADELKQKLNAFRQPDSTASVMAQIAKAYSEDELHRLAEYFSQQPPP